MSNNHLYGEQLQNAIKIISAAASAAIEQLQAPELASVKISIAGQLNKTLATLHSLGGTYPQQDIAQSASITGNEFKPVTSFLGTAIKHRKPITTQELSPTEESKQIFLQKREDLHDRFLDTSNEDLLKLLNEPKGETLIRSVGKKVMLPEHIWRNDPVDIIFLDAIRGKIQEHNDLRKAAEEADQAARDYAKQQEEAEAAEKAAEEAEQARKQQQDNPPSENTGDDDAPKKNTNRRKT